MLKYGSFAASGTDGGRNAGGDAIVEAIAAGISAATWPVCVCEAHPATAAAATVQPSPRFQCFVFNRLNKLLNKFPLHANRFVFGRTFLRRVSDFFSVYGKLRPFVSQQPSRL